MQSTSSFRRTKREGIKYSTCRVCSQVVASSMHTPEIERGESLHMCPGPSSRVQGKRALKPLCDRHYSSMDEGYLSFGNLSSVTPVFKCTTHGCTRVYDHGIGYYDFSDLADLTTRSTQECSACRATQYVASFDKQDNQLTWRCGESSCATQTQVALQMARSS